MLKYEKCLTCKQLGDTCDGPNFITMETSELGLWCNELRKHKPWMTYDWIHNETGVSKSAVHGFLTGAHADYRRETFRPIVKCIIGGKWTDNPCGNISNTEKAAYEDRIKELEKLLDYEVRWRDDKIAHLQKNNASMEMLITNTNARLTKDKDFLRKIIVVLGISLGICLLVIITALVVDKLDPSKGFFWLRSFLGGDGNHWWPFNG